MNRCACRILATAVAALATGSLAQNRSAQTPPEPEAFRNPPAEMRPHALYPLDGGNLTRERIDADLQAMRDTGLGGVLLSADAPEPQQLDLAAQLIAKGDQLGLKIGLRVAPGRQAGTAPEQAMRQLAWTETRVTGDGTAPVSIELPRPAVDGYRDVAAIAFPASSGDETVYRDAVEAMDAGVSILPAVLTDRDTRTAAEIAPDAPLVVTMKAPFAAQAVTLRAAANAPGFSATIEASADGITWSRIGRVDVGGTQAASGTLNFASVEASMFRITPSARVQLAEALLHATPRLDTGGTEAGKPPLDLKARYAIDPAQVIDVSAHVDAAGMLGWTPPAGEWTVLRFGHVPADPPELDRLGTAAADQQFDATLGRVAKAAGQLTGKTFDTAGIAPVEAPVQSWTASLPADFARRTGYAITPYLPALTGRIVGDLDTSGRFLFDVRRTRAAMIADNYYGRMQERASTAGLKTQVEADGPDELDILLVSGRAQVPMAGSRSLRTAVSAGHVYGKTVIAGQAEAAAWQDHPDAAKTLGNALFAQGVNQLLLDRPPAPQAKPWIAYLTRSQYMLRQGIPVADLLYFTGEDRPGGTADFRPQPPAGYQYDLINADGLLTRARVKDGRIVLANGASYRLLVLPPDLAGMTPPLAAKLHELVEAGMAVLGPRPAHPLTLAGKAEGDAAFRAAIDAVWGEGKAARKAGAGRVFPAGSAGDALAALKIAPDAECRTATPGGRIDWLHRKAGATHIYFVANARRRAERITCSFRVGSAAPSLWDAESGNITRAALFGTERDRTEVTFDLAPAGSTFVTLDFAAGARRIEWIAKDGVRFIDTAAPAPPAPLPADIARDRLGELQALVWESGAYTTSDGGKFKAEVPAPIAIGGPWTLAFQSGTATYARTIDVPEDMIRKGRRIFLDLGRVAILAGVTVNGKDLGVIWRVPHRVDITDAVKAGPNAISVALAMAAIPGGRAPDSAPPGPVRLVFADQVKVE